MSQKYNRPIFILRKQFYGFSEIALRKMKQKHKLKYLMGFEDEITASRWQ